MSAQPYRGTVRIRDVFPSASGEEIRQRSVEAAGLQQGSEPILVEHRHTQRLGLVELRSGVVTGDDIVGLLRHRARGLATGRQDRFLDSVAGERRQRTGGHDRQSLEGLLCGVLLFVLPPHSRGLPGLDDLDMTVDGEPVTDARSDRRTDAFTLSPLPASARSYARQV